MRYGIRIAVIFTTKSKDEQGRICVKYNSSAASQRACHAAKFPFIACHEAVMAYFQRRVNEYSQVD